MNEHFLAGTAIALLYFTFGFLMSNRASEPSRIFGYRTSSARRNMDTWLEANHFAGRTIMLLGSFILLVLILFSHLIEEPGGFYPVLFAALFVVTILVVFLTETHLNKLFFKDGRRRPNR